MSSFIQNLPGSSRFFHVIPGSSRFFQVPPGSSGRAQPAPPPQKADRLSGDHSACARPHWLRGRFHVAPAWVFEVETETCSGS